MVLYIVWLLVFPRLPLIYCSSISLFCSWWFARILIRVVGYIINQYIFYLHFDNYYRNLQNVLQTRPIYQSVVIMNCMQSVEIRSCKSLAQLWCPFLCLHISVELNRILNKRSTTGVPSEAGNFIFCSFFSFFLWLVHCLSDVRLLVTLRYISTNTLKPAYINRNLFKSNIQSSLRCLINICSPNKCVILQKCWSNVCSV